MAHHNRYCPQLASERRRYSGSDASRNWQNSSDWRQSQADAAHAAEDAHNASVEARWDSQARSNHNFSNYLLDQTVVQDNNTGVHATIWNQYADSLVKNDPNRYQYVQTPDFLKGIDY